LSDPDGVPFFFFPPRNNRRQMSTTGPFEESRQGRDPGPQTMGWVQERSLVERALGQIPENPRTKCRVVAELWSIEERNYRRLDAVAVTFHEGAPAKGRLSWLVTISIWKGHGTWV